MRAFSPALSLVAASLFAASPAAAQTDADLAAAFSGDWYVFDASYGADGQTCRLSLDPATSGDDSMRAVGLQGCAARLDTVATWRIASGQIILDDGAAERLVALGGTPGRLSGEFDATGDAVILERENGGPSKAALVEALRVHRCYYVGYSSDCAKAEDTSAPRFEDGVATISVLVALNVRSQPRREASVIGTIPAESSVTVNACLTASDGIWCRARFGETSGWMAKSAIRGGEWPVVTFVNDTTPAEGAAESG